MLLYIGTEYFISSGFWWHFDRCGLELRLVPAVDRGAGSPPLPLLFGFYSSILPRGQPYLLGLYLVGWLPF